MRIERQTPLIISEDFHRKTRWIDKLDLARPAAVINAHSIMMTNMMAEPNRVSIPIMQAMEYSTGHQISITWIWDFKKGTPLIWGKGQKHTAAMNQTHFSDMFSHD